MSFGIIVRKYDGYNSAMGKHITSKKHYQEEMRKGGYISYDKACQNAESVEHKRNSTKLELSQKAREIIETAKLSADRKGRVRCGDRIIDAMKDVGVGIQHPQTPKGSPTQGGF